MSVAQSLPQHLHPHLLCSLSLHRHLLLHLHLPRHLHLLLHPLLRQHLLLLQTAKRFFPRSLVLSKTCSYL